MRPSPSTAGLLVSLFVAWPAAPGVKLHHMVTIRLAGKSGSGIRHVINGTGDPVIATMKAIVD
jgi:hypothetical protein